MLDRLLTALDEVKKQVAGFDKIEVHVPVHRHMASVMVDNRRVSISTDMAHAKFTVVENYWSHADGRRNVESFYSYETDDEVLRLVMETIGKFIALQKVIDQRRAAAAGPI